jgi:hypothetical protein
MFSLFSFTLIHAHENYEEKPDIPKNPDCSAFFLASRDEIYDNTQLEGLPSCRKTGWVFLSSLD